MDLSSQEQPATLTILDSQQQQQQYTEPIPAVPNVTSYTYGTAAGPYPVEQYTHIIYSVAADPSHAHYAAEIGPAVNQSQTGSLTAPTLPSLVPAPIAYAEINSSQYSVSSADQHASHIASDNNNLFQPKVVVLPTLEQGNVPSGPVPIGHADSSLSGVSSTAMSQYTTNALLSAGSLDHPYQYYSVQTSVPQQTSALSVSSQETRFSEQVPITRYAGNTDCTESTVAMSTSSSDKPGLVQQNGYKKHSLMSKVPSEIKVVNSVCYCDSDMSLKEIYTCACCDKTFPLICLLNKHMKSHESVTSYYFSLDTNTAYPKFEQSCRAVQTELCWDSNDNMCESLVPPNEIESPTDDNSIKMKETDTTSVEDLHKKDKDPEIEESVASEVIAAKSDKMEPSKPKRAKKRKGLPSDEPKKCARKKQENEQKSKLRKRTQGKEKQSLKNSAKNIAKEEENEKEKDDELELEVVDVEKKLKQDTRNVGLDHSFAKTDPKNRRKQPKERIVRARKSSEIGKNINTINDKMIDTVVCGNVAVPVAVFPHKELKEEKANINKESSNNKADGAPGLEEDEAASMDNGSGDETETDSVQLEYAQLNDYKANQNLPSKELGNTKLTPSKTETGVSSDDKIPSILKSVSNEVKEKDNECGKKKVLLQIKKLKDTKLKKEKQIKPKIPKVSKEPKAPKERKLPKEPKVPKDKKPNVDLYASCTICNEIMLQKRLKSHMLVHTGKKEFVCEICGQAYNKNCNLYRHKLTHQEIKPFQCKFCPAQFCRKKDFTYHVNSHKGYRPHVCNVCDVRFLTNKGLIQHQENVHMGITRFQCDMCDRRFFKKSGLHAHRATHFDATLECRFCDKKFRDKCGLNKHERTHTGQKHYQCHICEHAFNQCTPYYMHMEKRHSMERQKIKDIMKIVMEAKKRDGEKVELFRVPSNIHEIVTTLKLEEEIVLHKPKENSEQTNTEIEKEKINNRGGPKYKIDLENMGNLYVPEAESKELVIVHDHHEMAGNHHETAGDGGHVTMAIADQTTAAVSLQTLEPMKPLAMTFKTDEEEIKKYYTESQVGEAINQAQPVQTTDGVVNYSLSNQVGQSGNLVSLEPVKSLLQTSGHPKQKMKLLSQYAGFQQQQQKVLPVHVMSSGSVASSKLQILPGSIVTYASTQGVHPQAGNMDSLSDAYTASDFLDRILQGH